LTDRYLLYLDVLGFERMVAEETERVGALMRVIDQLNAHRHPNFKSIVFSDTLLVYNTDDARNEDDDRYLVMYLIEFAMDLHSRLVGSGIFLRAVIRWGQFNDARLKNIETFYGSALIEAYWYEKTIPCTGLFLDNFTAERNPYYPMVRYYSAYRYVLLRRGAALRVKARYGCLAHRGGETPAFGLRSRLGGRKGYRVSERGT
jgi:hypothetical protein